MRGFRDDRRWALFGVAGPLVFLAGVILVSWAERDFMAGLGWDQWPSGTALGPHGWITVLTFLLTALCQIAFGAALFAQAGEARVRQLGPAALMLSGLGMAVLAFKTDREDGDQTWHGLVHVIGYFTFFFSLLLGYILLAWARGSGWIVPRGSTRHWLLFLGLALWCCRTGLRRGTTSSLQSCLRRC